MVAGQSHLEELSLLCNKANPVSIQSKGRDGFSQGDKRDVCLTGQLVVDETLVGARVNEGADWQCSSMPREMGLQFGRANG